MRLPRAAPALAVPLAASAGAAGHPADADPSLTPVELRRPPEQTYLTFPECFLVDSPGEFADHITRRPPSGFPYLGHVRQFWQGYREVTSATKDLYPFNTGYHVMIGVIGVSTTVGYGLRWSYETAVGRLTEWMRDGETEEDRFAAGAARRYADFLEEKPWYEDDFAGDLAALWRSTDPAGPAPLRKWERRCFLTTEYAAKTFYGWVIGQRTGAGYEAESPVTAVAQDRVPERDASTLPDLKVPSELPGLGALVTVPRYGPFKEYALELSREGACFREVAGNRGEILVGVLAPRGRDEARPPGRVIFSQPILTDPSSKRLVLAVSIATLEEDLPGLSEPPLRLEHVYDF